MVQLHEISINKKKKTKKRIGRGGKRGTYSGRGQNGQRANAGGRLPSPQREQIKKFPKLSGLKNKKSENGAVINVGDMDNMFSDTKEVNKKILLEKGIINSEKGKVKILGSGDISKSFTIENIPVSAAAKKKIEDAGGKVV